MIVSTLASKYIVKLTIKTLQTSLAAVTTASKTFRYQDVSKQTSLQSQSNFLYGSNVRGYPITVSNSYRLQRTGYLDGEGEVKSRAQSFLL